MVNSEAVSIFNQHWRIYRKMLEHNYMLSRELIAAIDEIFLPFYDRKIDILDLGCGDAFVLTPLLKKFSSARYTGYDLSEPALAIAATNLHSEGIHAELKKGAMEELIRSEINRFDFISSSFAIHHLPDEMKKQLYLDCYHRLYKGGTFIYIDVFRLFGQSREQYLSDYFNHIRSNWLVLDAGELKLVEEHIGNYDFPANIDDAITWLTQTGFHFSGEGAHDQFHHMLVFTKE